jgi:hypothetical protein
MSIDWSLVSNIAAPVLALPVGAALDRFLERRPRLLTFYGHVSSFTLHGKAGASKVHTHSIVVINNGRKTATNVRLGHNYLPSVEVNPSVPYTVVPLPSGGHEIVIPLLVPREQVTVSYLYFPPITFNLINTYVKSDEGMANAISVLPTRPLPRALLWTLRVLVFAGVVATLYAALATLRALLQR